MLFTENNTFVGGWMVNHCTRIFDLWTFKQISHLLHSTISRTLKLKRSLREPTPASKRTPMRRCASDCFSKVVMYVICHIMSMSPMT